jgi:hypothetical protein
MQVKQGSLTIPDSNGDFVVSGLTFQPNAILFYAPTGASAGADGTSSSPALMVGAATFDGSVYTNYAVCHTAYDSGGTAAGRSVQVTDSCIRLATSSSASTVQAALTAVTGTSFTLNFSNTSTTDYVVHYIAIECTNAELGAITAKTTTGSQSYTTAFQPDLVFFFAACLTSSNPLTNSTTASGRTFLGFTNGSSNGCVSVYNPVSVATTNTARRLSNTSCISYLNSASEAGTAACTALTATGFDLNWTTSPGSANYIFYLALKGPVSDIGTLRQPLTDTSVATPVTGIVPEHVLLLSTSSTALDTIDADYDYSLGGSDGTTDGFIRSYIQDNVASGSAVRLKSNILTAASKTYSGSTVKGVCDSASFASEEFTTTFSGTDGTQPYFVYLVMGEEASGGGGGGTSNPYVIWL